MQGVIRPHYEGHGVVFTGLFPECVPEGWPVRCAVLAEPGPFRFENVPPGRWYLSTQSVADADDDADLQLKRADVLDPPLLLTLMDVRRTALDVARRAERHGGSRDSPV
ncbi:hypothetical protein [Streptomyces sp. HUAS ZL42]|uniref:hypothetical protein n=1 Tax=Streptomyces sp. HUAS ZL42 TaxID=3231715 RepID=UPI00345EA8A1